MAAGPGQGQAPGLERCPHCQRPFKRLRAHLPHCKAAPRPEAGPGTSPRPGSGSAAAPAPAPKPRPGSAPRTGPRPAPASTPAPGPSPAPSPRPAPRAELGPAGPAAPGSGPGPARPGGSCERQPRDVEPAVQDVAAALDLRPEEVEDVPRRMESGVRVVIEKHRARVVREKRPRSSAGAAQGMDPDRAAHPQRAKNAPKSTHAEPRSSAAVRNVPGSSKGGKISLKATKVPPEPLQGRNSPGVRVQQEGTDNALAEEQRGLREGGGGYKAPGAALHPKNLHLSVAEGLGGLGEGTPKNELSSLERLRDSRELLLGTGRAPGLPPHQPSLSSNPLPTCSSQRSATSTGVGATGLEWLPDLYPECDGLRMLRGKRFQEDVGITVKTPGGSFSEGQRGPLSERPLMEVTLGELHTWISTCDFSPQGLLGTVQRAWNSYYAKYINVRRGGPAGISMLLAGYCLLSYSWNYQHFKHHRWRKYH
ncbi:mitochondrial nucleoid-associated protein 1 isoform X2 [Pithys albifrons albifrons]|uniref:mitochondrial nucleoid-associated protein 1 isoform X2 n=1 Tax=Pithys albifrons albifrons TaxID=3385563 RepID=UPI003A5D2097